MHVGDVLDLRFHELVLAGGVGELEDIEGNPPHALLRQRVQPGDVRALVVDLHKHTLVLCSDKQNTSIVFRQTEH